MDPLKHSILLAVKEQLESPCWTDEQWWEAFRSLYTQKWGNGDSALQDSRDDLLFFVARASSKQPLFVRRKTVALPPELQIGGAKYPSVDWKRSVLLNHVLQTSFELTVVCCGQKHLSKVAQGGLPPEDASIVTKQVFASPMKTEVNLDCSRADESSPAMSYPDICFAVDNFTDAFEDTVLSKGDDCYCVVLHGLVEPPPAPMGLAPATPPAAPELESQPGVNDQAPGSATAQQDDPLAQGHTTGPTDTPQGQPADPLQHQGGSNGSSSASRELQPGSKQPPAASGDAAVAARGAKTAAGSNPHKVMLFAGYVAYHQIVEFMEASRLKLPFGSWFGLPPQQKEKIIMNGPSGLGRCEVAVTRVLLHPAPWQLQGSGGSGGSQAADAVAAATAADGGTAHQEEEEAGEEADVDGTAGPWSDSGEPLNSAGTSSGTVLETAGSDNYVWVDAGPTEGPGTPPTGVAPTPRSRARGLFAKMQKSVIEVAHNIHKAVAESTAMAPSMHCALMALSLPVEVLSQRLLDTALEAGQEAEH